MVQETAAKWLDGLPLATLQRGQADGNATLWRGLASLGLTGLAVDEMQGGAGLGLPGIAVVMRECGKRRLISPLLSSGLLAVDFLTACGSEVALQRLAAVAEGRRCLAVAASEVLEPGACEVTAVQKGLVWQLTGRLAFVADMGVADALLLALETASGRRLFEVPADKLTSQALAMVDGSDFAHLSLDVELAQDGCLGELPPTEQSAVIVDRARLALAAELAGLAQSALQMTVEYLQTREQFGQKIGGFQALQHRMAKAFIKLELAEASVDAALQAGSGSDFSRAATVAAEMATQAAGLIARECVQMHGGIGMTDEHLAGHYLKRARVLEQRLGGDHRLVGRYATLRGY